MFNAPPPGRCRAGRLLWGGGQRDGFFHHPFAIGRPFDSASPYQGSFWNLLSYHKPQPVRSGSSRLPGCPVQFRRAYTEKRRRKRRVRSHSGRERTPRPEVRFLHSPPRSPRCAPSRTRSGTFFLPLPDSDFSQLAAGWGGQSLTEVKP